MAFPPNACNSYHWARLKIEAWSSLWVPSVDGNEIQVLKPPTAASLVPISRKLELGVKHILESRYSDGGYRCPEIQPGLDS